MQDADSPPPPDDSARHPISAEEGLAFAFDAVQQQQYDLNRRAAERAAGIADAVTWARQHPWIYALPGDHDERVTAERCAVMEASCRLHLSESVVRDLVHIADAARADLPALWSRAREGFAALAYVQAAVALLPTLGADAAAVREFDTALGDLALHATPTAFRSAAKRLAQRLSTETIAARHASADARRRVIVQPADDGMAWVSAYVSALDAVAIRRRLTATAKRLPRVECGGRTRDQVRADLFTAWLRGTGTPTAAKTKVFLTVPLTFLSEKARAGVRRRSIGIGPDLNAAPQLLGEEDLDAGSAIRELIDAGRFTRVITDPVTGVILDMDRRSRTVTRHQRDWLILQHGLCTRDGCTRHSIDADIDHWKPYALGGPTDLDNLHPLCPSDHAVKHHCAVEFHRRQDLTVQVRFPTGFATAKLFWWNTPPPDYGDIPPF